MSRLKDNERIIIRIGKDFFDSDNLVCNAVLSDCLNSYRRFSGLFSSQFQVLIDNDEKIGDLEVRFESCREGEWLLNTSKSVGKENDNSPVYYVSKILDVIGNDNLYMKDSIDFFVKNRLWEIEMNFLHLRDSKGMFYGSRDNIAYIIRMLKRKKGIRDRNEYMIFLYDYLKVMYVWTCKEKYDNFKKIRENLNDLLIDRNEFYNNCLFDYLICIMSEVSFDVKKVSECYRYYVNKLDNSNIDVYKEYCMAYSRFGNFLSDNLKVKEKISKNEFRKEYKKVISCYENVCKDKSTGEIVWENYEIVYDWLNSCGKLLDLKKSDCFVLFSKFKSHLVQLVEEGKVDFGVYKYLFRVNNDLGKLNFILGNYKDADACFRIAENIFDKDIELYLKLMYSCNTFDDKKLKTKIIDVKDSFGLLGFYETLAKFYLQIDGCFSNTSIKYEKKYFQLSNEIDDNKKKILKKIKIFVYFEVFICYNTCRAKAPCLEIGR